MSASSLVSAGSRIGNASTKSIAAFARTSELLAFETKPMLICAQTAKENTAGESGCKL